MAPCTPCTRLPSTVASLKARFRRAYNFLLIKTFFLTYYIFSFIIFLHEIIPSSECLMSPGPRTHELIPPCPWHHYFSHAVNDIHNVQGIHCLCLHQSLWHLYSYLLTIITFIECSQYLKISTLSNCLHSILKVRKISYFWRVIHISS